MNRILFGLVLLALSSGCSAVDPAGSSLTIQGGVEDTGSYRGVVGLWIEHTETFKHFCTGTIVRRDLVLTAAHCLSDYRHENILTFKNYLEEGGREGLLKNGVKPLSYVKHPKSMFLNPREDLAPYLKADVAFVVYPKDTFDESLIVPLAKDSVQTGEEVQLVGYGATGPDPRDANPNAIRRSGMNIVFHIFGETRARAIMLKRRMHVPSSALGFYGDSGGPLITKSGKLVGVLSYGVGATDAYYANVTDRHLRSFIDSVLKGAPILNTQASPQPGGCQGENSKKVASGVAPQTCSLPPSSYEGR